MSTRITHQADGTARVQTQQNTANSIIDLRKQPARTCLLYTSDAADE